MLVYIYIINSNILPTVRLAFGALLFVTLAACGDKFVNGSSGATANSVTVSGVVSITALKPVLKPAAQGNGHRHAAMGGGKVEALDSKGNSLASADIGADGSFSLKVPTGSNYLLRATKGNVCLKAYVEKADSAKFVSVDPLSSAAVKVLGKKIGDDLLGEPGHDFSTSVSGVDMPAIMAAIKNSGLFATVAQAIADDIAAHADYAAVTASVGVVSSAGDAEANAIAITIVIVITINGQQANAPAAPAGVSATAGDGVATVSWSAVSGAETYNLYYSGTPGVAGIPINGITGTTYTVAGLTNGSTYYFTVTAVRSGVESAGSSPISATPQITVPAAPAALSASGQNGSITLSWPLVDKAVSYDLYWRATPGVTVANGTKIADITGTSYTHTGLTNGTAYHYILVGVNAGGQSAASAETAITLHGWTAKKPMPTTRLAFTPVEVNGVVYMFGGVSNNSWVSTVEAYNPVTNTWVTKTAMPTLRLSFGTAVVNGIIYVIGGTTDGSTPLGTVEAYNPATDTWTTKAPMPTAREMPAVVNINGTIYAIGGGANLKMIEKYDPVANMWSTVTPTGTYSGADGRLAAIYLNRIYTANTKNGVAIVCYDPVENTIYESSPYARVAGIMPAWSNGLFALNGIFLADPDGVLGEWDTINQAWRTSTLHANSRTSGYLTVFYGEIWVLGNYSPSSGVYSATSPFAVDAYDPVTKVLSSKAPLTKIKSVERAVVVNGSLYIFGGTNSAGSYLDDVEDYQ